MELSTFMPADVLEGCNLDSEQEKQAWAEELRVMAHTHYASFPLTTPQERDTFMHGMVWLGETDREHIWPLPGKGAQPPATP